MPSKLAALKVATQEAQLNGLEAEVETRVRMEQVVKRDHQVAEAKKAAFLNELKVRCGYTPMLAGSIP